MRRIASLALASFVSGCSGDAPVVLGRCVPLEPCHVLLEAEDFQGSWAEQYNVRGAFGRGVRVSNATGVADSSLVTHVEVPAGTYTVWSRAWVSDADRRWRVEVAGVPLEDTHAGREGVEPGFEWQRAGQVELQEGRTELRIVDRGDSWETPDVIVLTSDVDFEPDDEKLVLSSFDDEEAAMWSTRDELVRIARDLAAAVPEPESDTWPERRASVRARVLDKVGLDFEPPPAALQAALHGTVAFDGYRVEKVSFESRPGLVVPAHVYVPDGDGPFPAVVSPIGHFYTLGKANPTVAARAAGLAKLGVLTIVYDAFGQGERDVEGHTHDAHWWLRLTGRTNMTLMVWETVRALDYLLTRPDVDRTRVGLTGASGGGLNTLYAGLLDARFTFTAPVVYVTQLDDIIASGVQHDGCSILPGLLQFTNSGEIAGLTAPRPQLLMAAEGDVIFPVAGAEAAAAQAAAVYGAVGAEDGLAFEVFSGGHDYGRAMRERMYGFAAHAFGIRDQPAPIAEPDFELFTAGSPESFVFESGRIPGSPVTPMSLTRAWAEAATEALAPPAAFDLDALQDDLQVRLSGGSQRPETSIQKVGTADGFGDRYEVFHIRVGPDLDLPAYLLRGAPGAPLAVVIDGADAVSPAPLEAIARRGWSAVHVSLRGWGELRGDEFALNEGHITIGQPLLGARAQDLVAVLSHLRAVEGLSPGPAVLLALGRPAGVVGLFSQAAYGAFDAAVVGPTPSSYLEMIDQRVEKMLLLQSVLTQADLPQVASLAARRPLAWVTSWGALEERSPAWFEALESRVLRSERGDIEAVLDAAAALLEAK